MTLKSVVQTSACLAMCVLAACSKSSSSGSSSSSDTSASGLAASAVGGALSDSDSTNSYACMGQKNIWSVLLPTAFASTACPTVASGGTGCAANGNSADLTYSACSFGSSTATWSGTLEVSLLNGGAVTCGTFPEHGTTHVANNDAIIRKFVSAGSAGTGTRTNSAGTVLTIDHATANLGNFDTGTTISGAINSGYGTEVIFDGAGNRKGVKVQERVYTSGFDHSVNGTLTVSESSGTRTVSSGTVTVYHNKLRVIGSSSFSNVVYNRQCCYPVSGSITTTFSAGAHVSPTTLGALAVGKSETMTFTGCGSATLTDAAGDSASVTLNHCF